VLKYDISHSLVRILPMTCPLSATEQALSVFGQKWPVLYNPSCLHGFKPNIYQCGINLAYFAN